MPLTIVRAMSACFHSSSRTLCDTPRLYWAMPTLAATSALTIATYFAKLSSLLTSGNHAHSYLAADGRELTTYGANGVRL